MAAKFGFEVKGFEQVTKKLLALPDKIKKDKINVIQRRVAKKLIVPAVAAAAPIADKIVTRKTRDGNVADTYDPGNLAESIVAITGKRGQSKVNPTIYVGPGLGKRKDADGYYGFFVVKGTKRIAPNDFITRGGGPVLPRAKAEIEKGIVDFIVREGRKLGLDMRK